MNGLGIRRQPPDLFNYLVDRLDFFKRKRPPLVFRYAFRIDFFTCFDLVSDVFIDPRLVCSRKHVAHAAPSFFHSHTQSMEAGGQPAAIDRHHKANRISRISR